MEKLVIKTQNSKFKTSNGQSIIEAIIGIGIGAILIGAAALTVIPVLRSNLETRSIQVVSSLLQEYLNNAKVLSESDWQIIYNPPAAKGPGSQFYLIASGTMTYKLEAGATTTQREGRVFTRYLSIENVNRDSCGTGNITTNLTSGNCGTNFPGGESNIAEDPSTQKITSIIEWQTGGTNTSSSRVQYVTRSRNKSFVQTDWSGGATNQDSWVAGNKFTTSTNIDFTGLAGSITIKNFGSGGGSSGEDIDSTYKYAWNDVIGWIDFNPGIVKVRDNYLEEYANSSVGYIQLNCSTSPPGGTDDCASYNNWKVSNSEGTLSGWAWNDAIGWISFDAATAGSSYFYGVTINPTTGDFSGWAWNDIVGWISFNKINCDADDNGFTDSVNNCGGDNSTTVAYNYKVKTDWIPSSGGGESAGGDLTSSVFDTGTPGGVAFNTIMWKGNLNDPNGGAVNFQIASSDNPDGPWSYYGRNGSGIYYSPAENAPYPINPFYHNNDRYFRYKVFLESDVGRTKTPRVDDIIINYSP